ncbi:MAG: hypothetical protein ACLUKN_06910 [Bacilli bacterium]
MERKRGFDEEVARSRAREILSEISRLDASKDISKISELVSEYNLLGADLATTEKEAELLDDCNKKVSEYQDLQVNLERSARARNMVSIELETPTPMPPSERLKFLKKLRSEAGETLDATSAKKLNSAISALSSKILAKRILTVGGGWPRLPLRFGSDAEFITSPSTKPDWRVRGNCLKYRNCKIRGSYPNAWTPLRVNIRISLRRQARGNCQLRETANLDIGNIERISTSNREGYGFRRPAMELENAGGFGKSRVRTCPPRLGFGCRQSRQSVAQIEFRR